MTPRPHHRPARLGLAAALWTVAAGAAAAQAPRTPPPLENVKVLSGWDAAQVRDEMRRVAEALGVKCDHCHVQGNFASDEKRTKRVGRRMFEMTQALNRGSFTDFTPAEGESRLGRVTCYTCHQGAAIPKGSAGAAVRR